MSIQEDSNIAVKGAAGALKDIICIFINIILSTQIWRHANRWTALKATADKNVIGGFAFQIPHHLKVH